MDFSSLEQRMAQTYIDMLPDFVPNELAPVGASEQRDFYVLIESLYRLAFSEPLLFVPALHDDDAYPNRYNKTPYGKPELIVNMRKFTKAVDSLLQSMFLAGRREAVSLSERQRAVLSRLGVDSLAELPSAWVWMSTREGACVSAFSHCFFSDAGTYTSDIYARLLGDPALRKLESWMLARGYRKFDIDNMTASDCKVAFTYANPAWGAESPRGGFEYKIRHTGIAVRYDFYARRPAVLGLCIPNGLKAFLQAFDRMDEGVRRFVVRHTKKCDGCRYCVQTDKTGARPLACVPVEYVGEKHSLCPYFPGGYFSWTGVDDELVDKLTEMLAFMDGFAPQK